MVAPVGWFKDAEQVRLEAARFGLRADIAGEQGNELERSRCLGWQRALLSRATNLEATKGG